jgi:hypothetical protein
VLRLLLALQTAGPAPCAPDALCRLLEAAAAANRAMMLTPGGYRAVVETETATLGRVEGRIEGPTLLEQTSSTVSWSPDGGFVQHVVGSRSFPNAIPISRLGFLRIGWVAPTLSGERLPVIARNAPGTTRFSETLSGPLAPEIVVHPLASDRETYYSFSGGREVTRSTDGTERKVISVEVVPVADLPREETLFEGEMDLDPESYAVVRLFGRFKAVGRPKRGMMSLANLFEPKEALVELVNQRLADGTWVPRTQRFEIESASSRAWGFGSARRVISRYHDAEPLPRRPGALAIGSTTTGYSLTTAPRDSLRHYRGWRTHAGEMTKTVTGADFSRFREDLLQPTGRPAVQVQGYHPGEFVRVNKVEGIFTGVSVLARLRDAAPGIALHATGGYAWSEKTFRGGGGVAWEPGPWLVEAAGGRTLAVTNKFRNQFDNPVLGALVGRDSWDYLDRLGAGLGVTRRLDQSGSIAQVEVATVEDRAVVRHMERSLAQWRLRENRNIAEGSYFRTRAVFELNPTVSPIFAQDGIGFRGELEYGTGDLDYTRVEARVAMRKRLSPFIFIGRVHAGAVFADHPPPQQLYELGGPAGLPGYEYKEFAGDRALLFRTRITYPLPMLDTPIRIGKGVTLPSLSPAISFGWQTGIADVRNAGGTAAVRALGDQRDDKTGELVLDPVTGDPLPVAVPTDEFHHSVDIRIGFFGDALAVGFARALEPGRKTTFIFAFGRQF